MNEENQAKTPTDDPMEAILNPEYIKKIKQQNPSPNVLSEQEKAEIEKQMSDPLRMSDSKIAYILRDLWQHPEKIKWYRDHVLFPTTDQKYFPELDDGDSCDWKVEIPVISLSF